LEAEFEMPNAEDNRKLADVEMIDMDRIVMSTAHQRTRQTRLAGDMMDYSYDPIGQLKTALGRESGGAVSRWHEQFGYAYDAAGRLAPWV